MAETVGETAGAIDRLLRDHPHLYHYTTAAGLKGIVEGNSLWATYFRDMNDANEIHELRTPLVRELARRLSPLAKERRQKGIPVSRIASMSGGEAEYFSRSLVNNLYATVFQSDDTERTSDCYVSSFCSHSTDQAYEQDNGLLSQWRGYGKNGGFCLVFDTAALYNLFEQESRSYVYPYADLREVHYSTNGAPGALFSELLRRSEEIIRTAVTATRDFSVDEAVLAFVACATTFKHRGFFEEREVRLIGIAGTEVAAEMMKHVKGHKLAPLKPRHTIDRDGRKCEFISFFGRGVSALPIERVIVGPSRLQDANVVLARKIVGRSIPVSKSATPFIG